MNSSEDLIIILRIQEGVGFNKTNNSVMAIASLSGNQVETDIVPTAKTTYYSNNFIWETDRNSVKQLKNDNHPIKIEFYAIYFNSSTVVPSKSSAVTTSHYTKEFIGHVLLPIRNIPIQTAGKPLKWDPHWYKIVGTSIEWQTMKPQIMLFFTITTANNFTGGPHNPFANDSRPVSANSVTSLKSTSSDSATSVGRASDRSQCDREIIVGDCKNDAEIYIFNVLLDSIDNLKNIVDTEKPLRLFYTFLDIEKSMVLPLNKTKKNSIEICKTISIKFYLNSKQFESQIKSQKKNFLQIKLITASDDDDIIDLVNVPVDIVDWNRPSSDSKLIKFNNCDIDLKYFVTVERKFDESINQIGGGDTSHNNTMELEKSVKPLKHNFALELVITELGYNRKIESGIWQVTLNHPKADVTFVTDNIEIDDDAASKYKNEIRLKLYFTAFEDELMDLLTSCDCILTLAGPKGFSNHIDLDVKSLLNFTSETKHGKILMDNLFIFNLYLKLLKLGINFKNNKSEIQNRYFNDRLAYKIVEELEEWKSKEMENFIIDLREKESTYLVRLSAEWNSNKLQLESKLLKHIDECEKLQNALEQSYNHIKQKSFDELKFKNELNEAKLNLESRYNCELITLREKIRRLENDRELANQLNDIKMRELEINKTKMEEENRELHQKIEELEKSIQTINNNFLSEDDIKQLYNDLLILNQRLNDELKSKNFYKEKWAKLFRKMHKMNRQFLK